MYYRTLLSKSWSYLWKSGYLWLFTAAYLIPGWIPVPRSENIFLMCVLLLVQLFGAFCVFIGFAGIIRVVYVLFKNDKPSLANTWTPAWQNLGRILILTLLSVILALPAVFIGLMITALYFYIFTTTGLQQDLGLFLFGRYAGFFTRVTTLITFGALIRGCGVWDSMRHGLGIALKGPNLEKLLAISLFFMVLLPLPWLIITFCILWIQASLSPDFISAQGFQSYLAATRSVPYLIASRAISFITSPWHLSTLTLAYLGFTGESETDEIQPPLPVDG